MKTMTFALYFGNRGFFPESLIAGARQEMEARLQELGYKSIYLDAAVTRNGAIETVAEGRVYARFLEEHRGQFDGVILCLPNFGDETGAVAALQDAGVPIFVQAYPDELDKMGFSTRRDAFCGKFSIMDVFCQYQIPFTALKPHVVHPQSDAFARNLDVFARTCRVVNGMRRLTIGALGARTTAFKTVRFDELALQRHGVTIETFDLADIIHQVNHVAETDPRCFAKAEVLRNYTTWKNVPDSAFNAMVKLGVVIDNLITTAKLDAVAIRCWIELEQVLKIAPCTIVSELNDRGIPAACEVDVGNALAMVALQLASGRPATCLDWNNNYGDDEDKCILFHCGPVPQSLMTGKGVVVDHPMFAKALCPGCGFGPNTGRIAPTPMTYASTKTEDGKVVFYLGEGEITGDPVAADFFGCAGVAQIPGLQDKLQAIGYQGYRHHVSLTPGRVAEALREALQRYLKYEFTDLS